MLNANKCVLSKSLPKLRRHRRKAIRLKPKLCSKEAYAHTDDTNPMALISRSEDMARFSLNRAGRKMRQRSSKKPLAGTPTFRASGLIIFELLLTGAI